MTRPEIPYTVDEVAQILREKPNTVRLRCKAGLIKADKPADRYLIWPADLDAYIKGGNTEDAA